MVINTGESVILVSVLFSLVLHNVLNEMPLNVQETCLRNI